MPISRRALGAGMAAALAALAGPTFATEAGDAAAILKGAFDNYRAASSQTTMVMTVHRSEWERQMTVGTWTRGGEDALVRFLAPAKDAGNASLKLAQDTWMFDPKLNQVIKLPPSMMAQAWMGSDFSYNDLAKSEDLLIDYTHRLLGVRSAGGHSFSRIEAVPKPGAPVVWGKVEIEVRDDHVITEETFFDQDMKPARKMLAEKIGSLGGRSYPVVITMYPQDAHDRWTRVETTAAKFNVPIPAYLLTLSNLQNPRGL